MIGGRSGVGKTTVAYALHTLLRADDVRHALIEGDNLDLAWPSPWEHRLSFRNLAALWANYRDLGYRRLIYTNTVAVLEADELAEAMGDSPQVTAVLLTADDEIVNARLAVRETGQELAAHQRRSAAAARRLDELAPPAVERVSTAGRTPENLAMTLRQLVGW